eukprot:2140782-Rhodomonas_salina.4
MSGTDPAFRAPAAYLPTRALRDVRYAKSGTELAYAARGSGSPQRPRVAPYARATLCPVAISLRACNGMSGTGRTVLCYAMYGTGIAYGAVDLRVCYAMSDTDLVYICLLACYAMSGTCSAMSSTDMRYEAAACVYRPTRVLCDICKEKITTCNVFLCTMGATDTSSCYAMSGTERGHAIISLFACYAMSGTALDHAYARAMRDVQY